MRWFGRKAAQGAARPAFARGFAGAVAGEIEDWPASYETRVRAAYLRNPVAQRAVRLVAEGLAQAVVIGSEAEAVSLIGPALLEAAASHVLLHGNAFLQILPDGAGRPAELFALRPERVSIAQDARGWPAAYVYRAGALTQRIAAEDAAGRPALAHVRGFNPLDDHYGLGSLGAAAGAVAIHNAATRWNKALLDNAARPSGAMVYEPGEKGATLSAEQFDRLRAEMDACFAGARNAGRPMLLEGGLRWQTLSMSPADMDFIALKQMAAREIALAFGVPPILLGLPGDATYANYREANRALWRETILPLGGKILGSLARALSAWWPGLRIEIDLDLIPALSEERERLWRVLTAADFVTRDEKREMLGFDHE
ncbi:MAG: phage portal protein [Sphingomonas sanxanigenens]|uniref:Phage portal protein n=1 Tax=Sphingomonas sanxanigenens TaxID=397260 RepID=A0A2W5AAV1_9SPHN|nr:MAG: phage portal protein [Sphingomonas sanxanigenens]